MRLNLLDYDLSAVSGRGTTTVSQINGGLARVAESLAIVWISIHKDATKLDAVQNRIEQYIALDHYSKVAPNNKVKLRRAISDKPCYWRDATQGTLIGSADNLYFYSSTTFSGPIILDCCHSGKYVAAERKTATPHIAYTSSDLDILWQMQDGSASSAAQERNLLAEVQAQGSTAPSVDNLSKIIEIVDGMIEHNYFDGLTRAFEKIDLRGAHPAHMIALLRTTGINRTKIAGWEIFRDKVRERLEQIPVNIDKVMRGLI